MARRARADGPGAWHHVMNRGARKADIFRDDVDRRLFLHGLAEVSERDELEVHAYALLDNHYHLLVRTRHGTLSLAMRHVDGCYSARVNRRAAWDGPLFKGRFASRRILDDRGLAEVATYIHLNPVRAGLSTQPELWRWGSYACSAPSDAGCRDGETAHPPWLHRQTLRSLFGSSAQMKEHARAALQRDRVVDETVYEPAPGWFDPREWLPLVAAEPEPEYAEPGAILAAVCEVSGAEMGDLRVRRPGRRGNRPRRLAIWALTRLGNQPPRQVAPLVDARPDYVAKTACVMGRWPTATPYSEWASQVAELLGGDGGGAG